MYEFTPSAAELKKFRLSNGLTQPQAAELCRVSLRTYPRWEQDRLIPAGYWELLCLKLEKSAKKSKKGTLNG